MTDQEKQWFEALTRDRMDNATMLEKPSMQGVQRSVVDKYSDQAHFIYELLQNADDVKATIAKFRLVENGLYFTHNGSVRFSISNPNNEAVDTANGSLGHINAITSIANSNKTGASIGKFGVGFKAVFQYTQTPHIYDPKFWFKIERFIVPHVLRDDLKGRQPSETVFYFPFDHKTKNPEKCYAEILEKLKVLEFPVLFLSSLTSISFEAEGFTGKYTKQTLRELKQSEIKVKWLTLELILNNKTSTQHLLVFTQNDKSGYPYSIGYGLKDDGQLEPISRPAFCFFPTKKETSLQFIVHAPFLLTDSREGIKAGEDHNRDLVQQLAQLAADSLPILRDEKLIDDRILDIIPYDEEEFDELEDNSNISFKPFFTAIKYMLQTKRLLPAANKKYVSKKHAYWASDTELVELFSDTQLEHLTGTSNAHWIFRSLGKKNTEKNSTLANYIDGGDSRVWNFREPNLIISSLNPETILKLLTADFIAAQSQEWLHKLYAYLYERESYQKFVWGKPIFLDQKNNAVAAVDKDDQHILFLPDSDIEGYVTIKEELLLNEISRKFFEKCGIKKPSLRDEIYNKILPKYDVEEDIETSPHFLKFFRYFRECPNNEVDEYISLIEDKAFLLCSNTEDDQMFRGSAASMYFPEPDLKAWFSAKPETWFLEYDGYCDLVGINEVKYLSLFLQKLGVGSVPRVVEEDHDKTIDGMDELLSQINVENSEILWRTLSKSWGHFAGSMWVMKQHYGPRGGYKGYALYDTKACIALRTKSWILDNSGVLRSAKEVTIQTLAETYDKSSIGAEQLIKFLEIRDATQDTKHLSEEEAQKIELADRIGQYGLSLNELLALLEEDKRKKTARSVTDRNDITNELTAHPSTLLQEIENRRASIRNANALKQEENPKPFPQPNDSNDDTDDYTPKSVDYSQKLDRAKDRYASEIDHLELEQALLETANSLPKYSYGWFLALLELECRANSEKNASGKTISIRFGKVERDGQSPRTIVLKQPNRFIPQSIEEFSDVRVDLDFHNGSTGKFRVESFTAKEFSLLGKLVSTDELNDIDLGKILEARIEIQNPSFLLQQLLERFRELKLDKTLDMKANLTPNIEFIFGPPGTGKTTHLAQKVLIPMTQAKVLVLTPTNKAADVLTVRIMEKMGADTSYLNWLIRFGTSADERIEEAGILRERSFNIEALSHSVTVTTIARFAYDGFASEYGSKKLHEIKWDVIVIDEASMISLANIIYPLYQQKPQKFIIAGDPFQIEPIVAVEQWKDENIYSLVGLNKMGSFVQPSTEPHEYSVINLETQYRSIPVIGEIFSKFTYNGVLKHYRDIKTQRPLLLNGGVAAPLNLIKFPVSKYESIYRAKRLESGTPYQTYVGLFTFEFVRWLTWQIQGKYTDRFRIGVIAPYRAQANLLNRLIDSWVAKPDDVEIQVGTIHGFQGDECDAIIAVFNPPPTISTSSRMFLNKQNILNVAISRARDYLFIVMPDDDTEDVGNLHKIAKIEELVKRSGTFSVNASHTIEDMIWGNPNYLEENTFSTGHHMVNVYLRPERYYEVRSDDTAIDVQLYEQQDE